MKEYLYPLEPPWYVVDLLAVAEAILANERLSRTGHDRLKTALSAVWDNMAMFEELPPIESWGARGHA